MVAIIDNVVAVFILPEFIRRQTYRENCSVVAVL